MSNYLSRYNMLVESVEKICKPKNITCIPSNTTHWINFEFLRSDGTRKKWEINRMTFIDSGSNNLILNEISQITEELLNAK